MIHKTINTLMLLAIAMVAPAQSPHRSEGAHYDTRKDAESLERSSKQHYIEFKPTATSAKLDQTTFSQTIEVDQSWVDAAAYIHLEGVGSAYDVMINGATIFSQEDSFTPTEVEITRYLRGAECTIEVVTRPSALPQLEEVLSRSERPRFDGSYIFKEGKLSIVDYTVEVIEDENPEHGRVNIAIIVENRFNYPESIEVGYDLYDPAQKLVEFDTHSITLEGGARDTIRFSPYIYGAAKYRWDPSRSTMLWSGNKKIKRYLDQDLYSLMIFTRRNSVPQEYRPLKVAFSSIEYRDGALYSGDNRLALKAISYNAISDKKSCELRLREIKLQGYNTIIPDYPQPLWFYSLCDKVGIYVIDQVAINAPAKSGDKSIGGTPSNDPMLLNEYLKRTQRAYYRTRNFSSVIAYSLGGESGNGYNMYKTYEWLKSVEPNRPIIYVGAAGEWNSDILEVER